MKKVSILAVEHAPLISIAVPADIFYSAGLLWNALCNQTPQPEFDVEIVSIDGNPVGCMNGIRVTPHRAIGDVDDPDLIVISAPSLYRLDEISPALIQWLQDRYERGTHLASICTGAFILAETGLLEGKSATTHWGAVNQFRERYPSIELKPTQLVTDEGDIFCSGGASSSHDLSFYLIKKYCGSKTAIECSKALVQDPARGSQNAYAGFIADKLHDDDQVMAAQNYIESEFSAPMTVETIAEKVGLSRRTLERKFKTATGNSPLQYLKRIRVEAAKQMLEGDIYTFDEITYQVGYEDSSTFRKVFVKHTGILPNLYRAKFRQPDPV